MAIADTLNIPFSKMINILVVEDDLLMLSLIADTLSSPLTNIFKSSSLSKAVDMIKVNFKKWHCWVVDLNLEGNARAGLNLIEKHPEFRFSIIHSGLHSLEIGAEAIRKGAFAIIDKGPDSIEKLIFEACKIIPIVVLCKGMISANVNIFYLLMEEIIEKPQKWADKAGLSLRQLENITIINTGLPPFLVIPFYYGFRFSLFSSFKITKKSDYIANIINADSEFYERCIMSIHCKLSLYKTRLQF